MVRISDPERLVWYREKFAGNAPYIEHAGDVTLILTKHSIPIRSHPAQQAQIRSILQETNWLIKEGPSLGAKYLLKISDVDDDFESFVLKTFYELGKERNIVFLEEEDSCLQPALSNGLDLDIYSALTLAGLINPALRDKLSGVKLAIFFDDLIRDLLTAVPETKKIDPVLIRKRLNNIFNYCQQLGRQNAGNDPENLVVYSSDIVSTYHAVMREHRQIGPRLVESLELPGKKTINMGRAHLWYIEKLLRGEQVDPPERFDEYLARFPEEYRIVYGKMLELMDRN